MTFVLDAGALIAADRGEARLTALLAVAAARREPVRVPTSVVAQVWRDGARQARLSRLLAAISEVPLDDRRARRVGELLRTAGSSDVVDGAVIELAGDRDVVLTSDPADLERLRAAGGRRCTIVAL